MMHVLTYLHAKSDMCQMVKRKILKSEIYVNSLNKRLVRNILASRSFDARWKY